MENYRSENASFDRTSELNVEQFRIGPCNTKSDLRETIVIVELVIPRYVNNRRISRTMINIVRCEANDKLLYRGI